MTASYTYNETLAVKGTFEPSFTGTFVSQQSPSSHSERANKTQESIIKISHEENDGNAAQLSDFLSDKLRVPQDRGFMQVSKLERTHNSADVLILSTFVLHPTENLANGGKTMATILGKK